MVSSYLKYEGFVSASSHSHPLLPLHPHAARSFGGFMNVSERLGTFSNARGARDVARRPIQNTLGSDLMLKARTKKDISASLVIEAR